MDIPKRNQASEMDKSASMRCQQHSLKAVTPPSFEKENKERKVDEFISANRTKKHDQQNSPRRLDIHDILEDL